MDSGPTISNLFNLQRHSDLQCLWTPCYLFKSLLHRPILLLIFQCRVKLFFRLETDILHWVTFSGLLVLNSCPYGIPSSEGTEQPSFPAHIESLSRCEDKPRRVGISASEPIVLYFRHLRS